MKSQYRSALASLFRGRYTPSVSMFILNTIISFPVNILMGTRFSIVHIYIYIWSILVMFLPLLQVHLVLCFNVCWFLSLFFCFFCFFQNHLSYLSMEENGLLFMIFSIVGFFYFSFDLFWMIRVVVICFGWCIDILNRKICTFSF